jgi:hypothetical protein
MSNMHDDKLEGMLKARHIEPANPDLAKRIILKAQEIPQKKIVSRRQSAGGAGGELCGGSKRGGP